MTIITKELALKIVQKLGARLESGSGRDHDFALVYHRGKMVAKFGIRRGSKKDLGHDHIPGQLHIRMGQARLLAQCPLSRDDWIAILAEKGLVGDGPNMPSQA
jgi:hypothetical protein